MDTYLPADFHALHDDSPTDWRDISSTCAPRPNARIAPSALAFEAHRAEHVVDPSWCPL